MSRLREVALLLLVFAILGLGYTVVWQAYLPVWRIYTGGQDWQMFLPPAGMAVAWLLLSAALTWRRCRETLLLPIVALLVGLGLLFLLRLAGGAATLAAQQDIDLHHLASIAAQKGSPALADTAWLYWRSYQKQFISFAVGWVVLMGVVLFLKDYRILARFKYVVAMVAVGLLGITTIFGHAVGGQTLTLNLGVLSFQPHDPVKLLLVIFMAAYLVEKRELISFAAGRFGMLTRLDLLYMGPLVALWWLLMLIVFIHKDLGAALLLFGAFLAILYLGTARKTYVVLGSLLFGAGMYGAYHFVGRVQQRVALWLDPWTDPTGRGYQICQSLMALGNGRVIGAGLAGGYPERIPAVHTDMIYAAISEDLGLVGAVVILALFLLLVGRMFHIAAQAQDRFGQLLAAGLGVTLALQTWVIIAGVTKFMPLTGITLPLISYGGTSLMVNLVLLGLVLKIAEQPREN